MSLLIIMRYCSKTEHFYPQNSLTVLWWKLLCDSCFLYAEPTPSIFSSTRKSYRTVHVWTESQISIPGFLTHNQIRASSSYVYIFITSKKKLRQSIKMMKRFETVARLHHNLDKSCDKFNSISSWIYNS